MIDRHICCNFLWKIATLASSQNSPKKTLTMTTIAASKKKKNKNKNEKSQLNSTQLRASQLHPRAQFCNTVASDGCRTLECVEKNHLLPSPDILLALVLRRFLFVGVGGWVVIFFLFFPHCSL